MIRVFLCHSSVDKPVVRGVAKELERFGAHIWIDERSIRAGDSLRESIENGLSSADFVLVFLSSSSICKTWVKHELSAAFSLEIDRDKKLIIPILIDDCNVPLLIRDKLYVDLRNDFKSGIQLLLRSLGLIKDDVYPESIETTRCIVELDILQADGSVVNVIKNQSIRCLHGISTGYTESFYTDGRVDSYVSAPGDISRIWKEAGRTYIETVYDKPLLSGDEINRHFECVMHDAFTEEIEFWEQMQHHPSSDITVRVMFPQQRPPKRYWVEHRHGSILKQTTLEAMLLVESNRPTIELTVNNPIFLHSYLLKWEW